MPELPEVETVRRGLLHLEGHRFLAVDCRRAGLRTPFPEDLDSIVGKRIVSIRRRAKFLLFELEDDLTLLVHLGMTGRFGTEEEKHSHVIFDFVEGERLVYTDPRRFGIIDLIHPGETHPMLAKLGPEPFVWPLESFRESVRKRRSPIKTVLMDAKVVVGIGNIYASEILFRAGVSPRRLACNVSRQGLEAIHREVPVVLRAAIEAGGSTLKDGQFRNVDGVLGYFPHEFAVYDRAGEDCIEPDCDSNIQRIVQSGRSTFFCSACQR